MSTPSAAPPPPTQGYDRPYYGQGFPPLPLPSGELLVFFLVWFVIGLVTLVADGPEGVNPDDFVRWSAVLAVGYMIGRGIAKAGRVFEGR
jgi:hypothetical protein